MVWLCVQTTTTTTTYLLQTVPLGSRGVWSGDTIQREITMRGVSGEGDAVAVRRHAYVYGGGVSRTWVNAAVVNRGMNSGRAAVGVNTRSQEKQETMGKCVALLLAGTLKLVLAHALVLGHGAARSDDAN